MPTDNPLPEPQHSGTILWIAVALTLACIIGVTLLIMRIR
jgi:hypothetical protein